MFSLQLLACRRQEVNITLYILSESLERPSRKAFRSTLFVRFHSLYFLLSRSLLISQVYVRPPLKHIAYDRPHDRCLPPLVIYRADYRNERTLGKEKKKNTNCQAWMESYATKWSFENRSAVVYESSANALRWRCKLKRLAEYGRREFRCRYVWTYFMRK